MITASQPPQPLGRRLGALALALSVAWPGGGVADPIDLPDMGISADAAMSPQKEREIGEAAMRELRKELTLVEDPEVTGYIQSLGMRLVSHSGAVDQRFTFFVIDDAQINAFAAPGGYIGVNSGLILAAESESELAAVLAHEIAHVTQRHIARRMETAKNLTVPTLAAMVAAVLIGTRNAEVGTAALAAAQAGAIQLQIDFTRAHESEADRVGVETLAESGFDPRSMPAFFERLQKSMRYYGRPPEFLSTHPVTLSRIADTRSRAQQYPYRQYPDSLAYQLVRAKLQVISAASPQEALEHFRGALDSGRYQNEQAARYGHALALKAASRPEQALAELERLLRKDPDNASYLVEGAKLELALGREVQALKTLSEGAALYPDNRALVLAYAEALLQVRRAVQARKLLAEFAREHDPDPAVYQMLARSQALTGDRVESHLSLAEQHYLMGQLTLAIEELERARKLTEGDFYKSSRIDARLAQLKEEAAARKSGR